MEETNKRTDGKSQEDNTEGRKKMDGDPVERVERDTREMNM